MTASRSSSVRVSLVAVLGTVLVFLYATLAAVQILVLNPLAVAPGTSLEQIHADLAQAGESLGTPFVLAFLSLGPALSVLLMFLLARQPRVGARATGIGYAVLLAFGAPASFIASFGPGMALADTYLTSGADHSGWSSVLYGVSALALAVAVVLSIIPQRDAGRQELNQPKLAD